MSPLRYAAWCSSFVCMHVFLACTQCSAGDCNFAWPAWPASRWLPSGLPRASWRKQQQEDFPSQGWPSKMQKGCTNCPTSDIGRYVCATGMMGQCWDSSDASLAAGACHVNSSDHDGRQLSDASSHEEPWEAPCSDATQEQLSEAMRKSQGTSQAAAYAKVLLRQAAWTALGVKH